MQHLMETKAVSGVITSPDKPSGRGQKLSENDFGRFCSELNLPVFKPASHAELNEILNLQKPDLVITVAYGRLIKKAELQIPKYGWLNIHFSLLPRWRGAAPVQYAILNGDQDTGVTVFKLDEGMDTGPIYSQSVYKLLGKESTQELLEVLSSNANYPLDRALEMIGDGIMPTPQSDHGVTLAPKFSKLAGKIDWDNTTIDIDRKVRALNPWPGAWTSFEGLKLSVLKVSLDDADNSMKLSAGEFALAEELNVGTASGNIAIMTVKPEGKREMTAKEWLRGVRDKSKMSFS